MSDLFNLKTKQLGPDDFLSDEQYHDIAGLIYSTDKYIFPAMFRGTCDTRKAAVDTISYVLKNGTDTMYRKENLFVCYDRQKSKEARVVGMILWYAGKLVWNYEDFIETAEKIGIKLIHDNILSVNRTFFVDQSLDHSHEFVDEEGVDLGYNNATLTLLNLCVDEKVRNCGIGTLMLRKYVSMYGDHPMEICVLQDNPYAVRLYKKCGFKIYNEFLGFSETQEKPMCFGMKRSIH